MAKQTTIRDLRDALRDVEVRKRQVDEEYRALAATLRYFESLEQEQPRSQYPSGAQPRVPSRGYSFELRNTMYEILTDEGPLHRTEIYERLAARGISVHGRDPVNAVGAHLSADPRFENVGRGEWDLSDLPNNEEDPQKDSEDIEATLGSEVDEEYERPHGEDDVGTEEDLPW